MRERGFTIVELIVAMVIISVLLTLAMIQFNSYTRKSQIESQMRMIYADLAEVRVKSLFQKRPRAVIISGSQFSFYSSTVTSGIPPVARKTLSYGVRSNDEGQIDFDANGFLSNIDSGGRGICLTMGSNPATVDSLVLSTTRIHLGKWEMPEGGDDDCTSDNIKQQ
ncbi:MAG: hypothetical protein A2075_06725 [Geobacteraceae bacterium GWC2_58_44]|nr:MAG: hypothetical protein A2075_06725 [Geobacteraceae bacterium GWC2_58_44]HBG08249.1 hypothetical protein [Geobacter sp.]